MSKMGVAQNRIPSPVKRKKSRFVCSLPYMVHVAQRLERLRTRFAFSPSGGAESSYFAYGARGRRFDSCHAPKPMAQSAVTSSSEDKKDRTRLFLGFSYNPLEGIWRV